MPSQFLPISHLPPKSSPSTEMMFKPLIYDDPSTTLLASSRFDDDHTVKPLLFRAASYSGAVTTKAPCGGLTGWYQKRRRRSNSDNCLCAFPDDDTNGTDGHQTIGQEVSHAAAETFLLTRLGLKLLSYLGYLFLFFLDPCVSELLNPTNWVIDLLRHTKKKDDLWLLVCKITDQKLLFRVGYRWITRFLALGCYAFLLMPGFIQGS